MLWKNWERMEVGSHPACNHPGVWLRRRAMSLVGDGGIYGRDIYGGLRDIWIYVYSRINDLACMHAREDCKETGVLVPLFVTLGKAVLFLAQSLSIIMFT